VSFDSLDQFGNWKFEFLSYTLPLKICIALWQLEDNMFFFLRKIKMLYGETYELNYGRIN